MKVLFYPHELTIISKAWDICQRLGLDVTNDPESNWDFAIYWDYDVRSIFPKELAKYANKFVINRKTTDVSKRRVDKVFNEVFGYSSFIDPTKHRGYCIAKSDEQGTHDGRFVYCPISPGKVKKNSNYQRLLDSRLSPRKCVDIRVPVFRDIIPCLFLKYQKAGDIFSHKKDKVEFITNINKYISKNELKLINDFCRKFPVEYAELDIIRNNSDGRIYIIDVNNIAGNPLFKYLPEADRIRSQNLLAQTFKTVFIDKIHK